MVMKEGTKTVTFRIPEELKLQIEMQAFRENRSVNNFLQYVVKEYLEEIKAAGVDMLFKFLYGHIDKRLRS